MRTSILATGSGLTFTADNYTRANLLDKLDRFAYYGVAAVLEAGTGRGDLPFQIRREARTGARYLTAGRGFAMPNAGPGVPMRDSAYGVTTEAEAREDVQRARCQHSRPHQDLGGRSQWDGRKAQAVTVSRHHRRSARSRHPRHGAYRRARPTPRICCAPASTASVTSSAIAMSTTSCSRC